MVRIPNYDDRNWDEVENSFEPEEDQEENTDDIFDDDYDDGDVLDDFADPEARYEEELESLEQEFDEGVIDEEEYEERRMKLEENLRRHQWNEEVLGSDEDMD